jgi:hypothetical protein
MTPEQKAIMLERLKAGKAAKASARADAKAKGLPDPHPRKKRVKKLAVNPSSHASANDNVRGIDEATKDGVAKKPVEPTPDVTRPIDVPHLPGDAIAAAKKKDIVKNAEAEPVAPATKGLSKTGKPKKVNATELVTEKETGDNVINTMFPGQEASIKKALKANKKLVTTAAGLQQPDTESNTVKNVKRHVPDVKSVEGSKPFSFSAIRKVLYQ